jgi:hypothetical protein
MKKLIFAYLGGLLASVPAYAMFNDVGASPFRNFDAVMAKIGGSLVAIVVYYVLLWIVPALGSAIGAKMGGHAWDFRYCYSRGVGGQFAFSIIFSILIFTVPAVKDVVDNMSTSLQTAALLMFSQIGCTLGTIWGL